MAETKLVGGTPAELIKTYGHLIPTERVKVINSSSWKNVINAVNWGVGEITGNKEVPETLVGLVNAAKATPGLFEMLDADTKAKIEPFLVEESDEEKKTKAKEYRLLVGAIISEFEQKQKRALRRAEANISIIPDLEKALRNGTKLSPTEVGNTIKSFGVEENEEEEVKAEETK